MDKRRASELRALRKEASKQLNAASLSAATAKDILKIILDTQEDNDLRLQELEREVGLPDQFISAVDSNSVSKII